MATASGIAQDIDDVLDQAAAWQDADLGVAARPDADLAGAGVEVSRTAHLAIGL